MSTLLSVCLGLGMLSLCFELSKDGQRKKTSYSILSMMFPLNIHPSLSLPHPSPSSSLHVSTLLFPPSPSPPPTHPLLPQVETGGMNAVPSTRQEVSECCSKLSAQQLHQVVVGGNCIRITFA